MPKTAGQQPSPSDANGFVLSIVVIVIGSLLSVVAVSTALASITDLEHATTYQSGLNAQYEMETCLDDSLLQIQRDLTWEGSTNVIDSVTCTTTITGSGNSRQLDIDANVGNRFYRSWTVDITLSPFSIDSLE